MKKIIALFFVILLVTSSSTFAQIEDFQPSPWTEQETYADTTIHKLGFGLLNLTAGWTAIPFEMDRNSNLYTGFIKGIWRTVTNTVGGALHTATFPIPLDIPLPEGGVHFE